MLRNADGDGEGGCHIFVKKRYEGVRFNVISVTRGWVGVQFPGKKRYVTLEWPLILEVKVNERSGLTFVMYGSPSKKHTAHTINTSSSFRYFPVRLPMLSSMAVTRTSTEANYRQNKYKYKYKYISSNSHIISSPMKHAN